MDERDTTERCSVCRGRGYLRCACWPGDCICGYGDESCDECGGTGWVFQDEYEDETERLIKDHAND